MNIHKRSLESHTHRFIELFACLCGVHFAREGDSGHGGVQGVDYAVVYGAHHLQHLLRNTATSFKVKSKQSFDTKMCGFLQLITYLTISIDVVPICHTEEEVE